MANHKRKKKAAPPNDQGWRSLLFYLLLFLLAIWFGRIFLTTVKESEQVSFSQFLDQVQAGQVKEVTIDPKMISGETVSGKSFKTNTTEYPNLVEYLRGHKVNVKVAAPASEWFSIFIQVILPVLLLAGFWFLMMRQAQSMNSQAMSFGRSRAKIWQKGKNDKITFKDVAGVDEAIEELKEIVDFLKEPEKFRALGAKIPKGVLLMGAPGTGKTLLARAVAGEADVAFFNLSGSDFVEMFVGVGASRVRDLFNQAKKNMPSIIFLDEIDAVGRHRGAGLGGGHDEREQTLNQILVEMDGFDPRANLILIAATNRPDILDPALLRPGRFDRQIVIDKPDVKGREAILKIHAKDKPLEDGVDLNILARRTPGFTGADLANLTNEAALLAARRGKKKIGMAEMEDSIDRVIAGPEKKSRIISDKEKEIVAYHEMGHAVVAKMLPHADPVHKVSILPRGLALGYTLQLPLEDKYLVRKDELIDQMTVMLGGRVAEELIFNEITSGAHNDLERMTELARRMVCEYGMSSLGPRTFGKKHEEIFLGRDLTENIKNYSDLTADSIDREIDKIVADCYQRAKKILEDNQGKLRDLAKILTEKETIEGDELEEILKQYVPTAASAVAEPLASAEE